jgi:hypothetical protein
MINPSMKEKPKGKLKFFMTTTKEKSLTSKIKSEPRITKIPGNVFDPLSIAYFFRLHPLTAGGKTVLPTCDGKRFQEVVVTCWRTRKDISSQSGRFLRLNQSSLKNLGGVFNKSPKGMLKVWYTDDPRRVPVRVSSKVIVGSFTASLVRADSTSRKL